MSDMKLDINKEIADLKFMLKIMFFFVVMASGAFFLPKSNFLFMFAAFGFLGIIVLFAQIVFGGVTILVLRAPVERKLILQIVIALVVPLFLSGIFFYEATPTWSTFQRFNWSLLLPISIIGWLSWKYGEVIDDEVPVRNFLIAAAILFVWCWFRRKGMYFEGSFDGESSDMFINSKVAKNPSVAAYYFVLYLLYILVSYASLLLRFKKSRY